MKSHTKLILGAISLALLLTWPVAIVRAATTPEQPKAGWAGRFGYGVDMWSAPVKLAYSAPAPSAVATPMGLDASEEGQCASDHCAKIVTFDPPGSIYTLPYDMNSAGAIIGEYGKDLQTILGFLRERDGTFSTIVVPGASFATVPQSISPTGEIAGDFANTSDVIHGFIRSRDGRFTTFDVLAAGTGAFQGTIPLNINEAGEIAGQYLDDANVSHGFLRSCDGKITTFDAPGAGTGSGEGTFPASHDGMNADGVIVGYYADNANVYHGFVRARDGFISTFDVPGAGIGQTQGTFPSGINPAGEIAGYYQDVANVYHGFVRHRNGRIVEFDVPNAGTAPSQGTATTSINAAAEITGIYIDTNGADRGFVRKPDGISTKFDVPGASTGSGGNTGTFPVSNNSLDSITGYYFDADGTSHGFLRTQ